jgi:hypothetical protein
MNYATAKSSSVVLGTASIDYTMMIIKCNIFNCRNESELYNWR